MATAGKAAAGSAAPADFEPLTEEEVVFCWLSLVESGQLSVQRLQAFMQEVCGEKVSLVQARDLLGYMDANGDGTVGREDFRNFVSVGRMADTNPQDFMWTPKRRYQLEHGGADKQPKEDDLLLGPQSARGGRASITLEKRASFDVPAVPGAGVGATGGAHSSSARGAPLASLPDVKAPEAKPQAGKRRGGGLAAPAGRGNRAGAANAEAEAPTTAAGATAKGGEVADKGGKAPPPPPPKLDKKARAHIDMSISKYEQASWQSFLKMEEDFRADMFAQFASEPGGMNVTEYHRMLMKWHKLAKWCMPGDLRPGDSLAALQYIIEREQRASKPPGSTADVADSSAAVAEGEGGVPPEAKMSFKVWENLINGKYRPEEHHTKASH